MSTHNFNTITELAKNTGIPVRTLRTLYNQRKISGIKLGHRTLLFDPEKVYSELARYEVKAVA
jgi:DNA-binding transcriptional MerR regulator